MNITNAGISEYSCSSAPKFCYFLLPKLHTKAQKHCHSHQNINHILQKNGTARTIRPIKQAPGQCSNLNTFSNSFSSQRFPIHTGYVYHEPAKALKSQTQSLHSEYCEAFEFLQSSMSPLRSHHKVLHRPQQYSARFATSCRRYRPKDPWFDLGQGDLEPGIFLCLSTSQWIV